MRSVHSWLMPCILCFNFEFCYWSQYSYNDMGLYIKETLQTYISILGNFASFFATDMHILVISSDNTVIVT